MTGELLFVLAIVIIVVVVVIVMQKSVKGGQYTHAILDRLKFRPRAWQRESRVPEQTFIENKRSGDLISEADSEAELERLKRLIEDRKLIARDADISHHLWGLYKNHFRIAGTESLDQYIQKGEWYDVKTLRASTQNGLNEFEFELKGAKYKFVDDEERHGWADKQKLFNLFLYDDSNRCLIEIPMKLRIDKWGRNYSISTDGPKAFLPGDWIQDFINVTLKHQSLRNQEIRAQKHQERLSEIEDLKDRFGIWD